MSELACYQLPLKCAAPLNFSEKVRIVGKMARSDEKTLQQLTQHRQQCTQAFDKLQRGTDYEAAEKAACAYLALLAGTMPATEGAPGDGPRATAAQHMCFFHWSQAFGPRTSYAHNDTVYEAAAVLQNLAAADLRHAHQLVTNANRLNFDKQEREAYKLCRAAAGKYDTAQKLMVTVEHSQAMPMDARPEVLEGLKSLALGQAQEIGLGVAARSEANRGKEFIAKLAVQAYELYDRACKVLPPGRGDGDKQYEMLAAWVAGKRELMHVRAFSFLALYLSKTDQICEALRAGDQAADAAARVRGQAWARGPLKNFVTVVDEEARRVQHKVKKDNEIVYHKRPAEKPAELPAPQELARPDEGWGQHGAALPPPSAHWTDEVVAAFVAR